MEESGTTGDRWLEVARDLAGTGRGPIVLVNPVVEAVGTDLQVEPEACLCFPKIAPPIRRPVQVTVRGRSRTGQPVRLEIGRILGRIIQHQVDHLDGLLITDGRDRRAKGWEPPPVVRRSSACPYRPRTRRAASGVS